MAELKRYSALKIQLISVSWNGECKKYLRQLEQQGCEVKAFRNHSGRFVMWIKPELVKPELFKYKADFNVLVNEVGGVSIPLYDKEGNNITINNYMDVDWQDMTDVNPIQEEE